MRGSHSFVGGHRTVLALAALLLLVVAALAGAARAAEPRQVSAPTVKGLAVEGETLTATSGSYDGAEPPWSFEYEWFRCGRGGADCYALGVRGTAYTLTTADIGWRVRTWVNVTGISCSEWNYSNMTRECRPVTVRVPSEPSAVVTANAALRPNSTAAPTITGIAEEGSQLRADDGGWTGVPPITTARQWERCDTAGSACAAIPGATAATYTPIGDDVGKTLRVVVTGSNPRGASAPVASAVTAVVGPLRPRPGRDTIGAALVETPERLVIGRVIVTPSPLRARVPVKVRVRVADTRGFHVRGALVRVIAVPASLLARAPDARTDAQGWATVRLRPTNKVVLRPGRSIQLLIRAFKASEGVTGDVADQLPAKVPLAAPRR